MINKHYTETIRQSAETMLECNNDFFLMKKAVDQMYQIFSKITGVTIDQMNQDKDIMLPSGKAISTASAAHCLLEMKRTALFLRGINKAILQKLHEKKGGKLRILYAGTGPYGTLVIPLLLLYSTEEIKVDLLDINPNSLTALQKIIETLGIGCYISEVFFADATTIKLNRQYDIAISETMQSCLKNEPQVAVMQNIIPQLSPATIFIPEEIFIDAYLTNSKIEDARLLYYPDETPPLRRIFLGKVFAINKDNLDINRMRNSFTIPADVHDFPVLKLYTTVKVFENEILGENDSSINLPMIFYDFRKQNARKVEFWYTQGEKPDIECKIKEKEYLNYFINFI